MGIGDIIYGLITLLLMAAVMFSPLLRKLIKSAGKNVKGESRGEDPLYDSVDSHKVVQRILGNQNPMGHIEFSGPESLKPLSDSNRDYNLSAVNKLEKMSYLKRAVIWKEILDKPIGLRDFD